MLGPHKVRPIRTLVEREVMLKCCSQRPRSIARRSRAPLCGEHDVDARTESTEGMSLGLEDAVRQPFRTNRLHTAHTHTHTSGAQAVDRSPGAVSLAVWCLVSTK